MIEVQCATPDETRAVARRLAPMLRPGDVVVLSGGLGAGKTLFTGGLAVGLGVDEPVVSPSFVLVRRYDSGFLPVIHADVYRLGSLNEFDDLDVLEMAAEGVLVIEWGDAVEAMVPDDHLRVGFAVSDDESRTLSFVPSGTWTERDLEGLI